MADLGRLDELKRKFDENPRRYFAPLANEFRKAGDTERAIELCRTYLPQQPNHMSGYIVYGQALHDAGRSDEATAVFKQALSLDPENIIALRHLGEIAEGSGDKAAAMRWFGKVLELDPRNEEIAGYITHLATPGLAGGAARTPPPAVRPEPEHDPAAVALADVLRQPDRPRLARFEPPRATTPETEQQEATQGNAGESHEDAQVHSAATEAPSTGLEEQVDDRAAESAGEDDAAADAESEPPVEAVVFEALDWSAVSSTASPHAEAEKEDDSTIGAIGPNGRLDRDDLVPGVPDEDEPAPLTTHARTEGLIHELGAWDENDSSDSTEPAEESGSAAVTGSPFVTETMAELYLQQGLDGDALVIYRQLALTRSDGSLDETIAEIEARMAADNPAREGFGSRYDREMESEPDEPPTARGDDPGAVHGVPAAHAIGETVREFFARIGSARPVTATPAASADSGRGSETALDALFRDRSNAGDVAAAESLAGAFGSPSTSRHA